VYPEQLLGKISKKAFTTLGCQADEFFEGMGYYFVEFTGKFGYVPAYLSPFYIL
jgi:guanylate cyclase